MDLINTVRMASVPSEVSLSTGIYTTRGDRGSDLFFITAKNHIYNDFFVSKIHIHVNRCILNISLLYKG